MDKDKQLECMKKIAVMLKQRLNSTTETQEHGNLQAMADEALSAIRKIEGEIREEKNVSMSKESPMPYAISMAIRTTVCFFTAYFWIYEKPLPLLYMVVVIAMCVSGFWENMKLWGDALDKEGK